MVRALWRAPLLVALLLFGMVFLSTCATQSGIAGTPLYVQSVTDDPEQFAGQEITIDGAYIWRPGDPSLSVLATGVSTLDNGLDAQPLGEPIWLEGFPPDVSSDLHRPGDSVYGFVRVRGQFESAGGYGPNGSYRFQMTVATAEAIEQVRRVEQRVEDRPAPAGQVAFFDLIRNPDQYNGQTVTVRGYYFWNSVIYVLAEGISVEEDGSSPQPVGATIWMEGFPPDQSATLNVGPNNSYVWGLVEVTGSFQTGGGFGRDGAYQSVFFVESAQALTGE